MIRKLIPSKRATSGTCLLQHQAGAAQFGCYDTDGKTLTGIRCIKNCQDASSGQKKSCFLHCPLDGKQFRSRRKWCIKRNNARKQAHRLPVICTGGRWACLVVYNLRLRSNAASASALRISSSRVSRFQMRMRQDTSRCAGEFGNSIMPGCKKMRRLPGKSRREKVCSFHHLLICCFLMP